MTAVEAHDSNIALCYPSETFEQNVKDFAEILLNRPSESMQAAKEAINLSR